MSDLQGDILEIVYKHLPGKHEQKRHGYRFGGSSKGYSTLERLRKDGDKKNTLDFLERIGRSGRIPYAAIRGEVGGKLNKSEIGAIRTGLTKYRDARKRRGAPSDDYANKILDDFENVVKAAG